MAVDEKRKEAMLAEIREAFAKVSRGGGVSWLESRVIDDRGSKSERDRARHQDKDNTWEEVSDDPTWRHDMGIGGFSFLDPIGFRYYLPAKMTVQVRNDDFDASIAYSLTLAKTNLLGLRSHSLDQWSLFNDRQKLCVRHFLEYMITELDRLREEENDELDYARDWRKALESCWIDFD